jgi:hypothetical protein
MNNFDVGKFFWKNKKEQFYFNNVKEVPSEILGKINPLMLWDDDCENLNLERACRMYPQ